MRNDMLPRSFIQALLVLLLCHGAFAQRTNRGKRDDRVVIHTLSDPETLNLVTATDITAGELHSFIYETLTFTDPYSLETIPWIAESLPRISEDRLSYEITLRRDARFSDGQPVTGEDFIFYLKCIKNPHIDNAAPQRGYYARIDRIELIDGDKYHIRAVMSEPYYLGDQFIGGLYAFPKHIWDPKNLSDRITFKELNEEDPEENPAIAEIADIIQDVRTGFDRKFLVGSGPYTFGEFRRNSHVELVRDPHYWNRDHKYGAAYPGRIVYRTINDPSAAVAALKSGEIDMMPMMEKVIYNREKDHLADYGLKPAVYDYPAYSYIGYNEGNPILRDRLVRRALSHAVDIDSIIRTVYYGYAIPVRSPIMPGRSEYDSSLPRIPYDLAMARKLLAQAGWRDSNNDGILDKIIDGKRHDLRFQIMVNAGNVRRLRIASIFAEALHKLGVGTEVITHEWATFLELTRDGNYDAYVGGWATSVLEGDMYQIWHSGSIDGGSNLIRYENPEVDTLIEAIRAEFDFEKRKEMYRRIQRILYDDQPYTFLVSERQTGAYSDRFENVTFFGPRPCYNPAWWRRRSGE